MKNKKNKIIKEHYKENYTMLTKRIRNRLPNKSLFLAEEVVQEAYYRALKYFSRFNPEINSFDVWFNTILKNTTNTFRNTERNRGIVHTSLDEIETFVCTEEEKQCSVYILKEINNTEEPHRSVLSLFFLNGFSISNISEYLGYTKNNVRQMIFRFRKKIKESGIIKGNNKK